MQHIITYNTSWLKIDRGNRFTIHIKSQRREPYLTDQYFQTLPLMVWWVQGSSRDPSCKHLTTDTTTVLLRQQRGDREVKKCTIHTPQRGHTQINGRIKIAAGDADWRNNLRWLKCGGLLRKECSSSTEDSTYYSSEWDFCFTSVSATEIILSGPSGWRALLSGETVWSWPFFLPSNRNQSDARFTAGEVWKDEAESGQLLPSATSGGH